jgi:predicted peptidase
MGGMGTYFLGQKYASRRAAIAPMSGTRAGVDYSLDRLRKVPIMVSAGGTQTATAQNAKAQIEGDEEVANGHGLRGDPEWYAHVHDSANRAQIFTFFSKHK